MTEIEDEIIDRRRWSIDRRITMGEVVLLLTFLGTVYYGGKSFMDELRTNNAQMDKRVTVLEEKAAMQQRIDAAQDAMTRDGQQRIEKALSDIQASLMKK